MIEQGTAILPLVWALILGLAITLYVLLDGFSLGVGILHSFNNDGKARDLMIASVAPVWDGNQTWLVGGGMALLTAFPKAFNLLLTVFYLPISLMLLALVFRGLAFEFIFKTEHRRFWNRAFSWGSIAAAFLQGLILGNFVQGFALEGEHLVLHAGYLLNPFAVFTGFSVVVAYALIGSCWLILKQSGSLQRWSENLAQRLLPVVGVLIVAISLITAWIDPDIAKRWFEGPHIIYLSPIPAWTLVSFFALWWLLRRQKQQNQWDGLPFIACVAMNLMVLFGLAVSLFPWIVPRHYSIWQVAAPDVSLSFALVGVALIVPVIILYTAHAYYVFGGKVSMDDVYH